MPSKKKSVSPGAAPAVPFEEALARLEEIVSRLERAEVPLDQALELYETGVRLARSCSEQLQTAERRVELLEDNNGSLTAKPFQARSSGAQGKMAGRGAEPGGLASLEDEESGDDPDDESDEEDGEESGDEAEDDEADDADNRGTGQDQETLF